MHVYLTFCITSVVTGGSSPWGGGGRPCNGVMFKLKDDIATYEVPKNNVRKLCDVCTVASLNGRVGALLNSPQEI